MPSRSKSKRGRRTTSLRLRFPGRWRIIQLMIVFLCIVAGWVMWLDFVIHSRFEGHRWELPARVFARPLEVYAGEQLSAAELEKVLGRTGYRAVTSAPSGPGQYLRHADSIELYSRRFDYWDGTQAPERVSIDFNGDAVADVRDPNSSTALGIFRIEPQLIGKIYPARAEDRVLVRYEDVPPILVDALVAVEDRHFFSHPGIDVRGMIRALLVDLRQGRLAQGGSTLTQQLVKNYFLENERTLWRKINEIIMALLLERRYSKTQILGAYINEVYLGQHGALGIRGFGTAAEFYFGRPLQELRVDQIALLVGLVRGASYYDPRRHPERALTRRNLVLELMCQRGALTCRQADAAKRRPLDIAPTPTWTQARFPTFVDLVHRELLQQYHAEDLRTEGLRIFTTIDPQLQERVEADVQTTLSRMERERHLKSGSLQTAAVVVNPANGEVLAALGGRDDEYGDFDRALDARRPIGSLVKPFIYATALAQAGRFNLLTTLDDSALSIRQPDGKIWKPDNYDRRLHGRVSLIEALADSYNVATVRLGMQLGLDKVIGTLHAAGYSEDIPAFPATLLGALDASPMEVAQMYQVLANGGFRTELNGIRDVLDRHGQALKRYDLEVRQAINPDTAFLTDFLLTKVVDLGTARGLTEAFADSLPLAGKTGTTNDLRDSWFAGFGDAILGVVWVGRDDNSPTRFTGATGAMRVWTSIMKAVPVRPLSIPAPAGIGWIRDVQLPFEDNCLTLPAVPFQQPFQPGQSLSC